MINEIDCPNEIITNKDFYCSFNLSGVNGLFDIKFQMYGTNSTINKVWNNGWQRSDWYLNGFIDKNGNYNIKNIIYNYTGNAELIIRIRESGEKSFNLEKKISLKIVSERNEENNTNIEEKEIEEYVEKPKINETLILNETSKTIIKLNYDDISSEIVYESRTNKIKNGLLFLSITVFVGLLIFQLFKYGKRDNDNRDAWES